MRIIFGGIFKPPTNKDLAFVTVPFSCMLRWHFYEDTSVTPCTCSVAKNKLSVTRSRKKTSKYKSGGNFKHKKADLCDERWPVWSWLDRSHILRKIQRSPLTRVNIFIASKFLGWTFLIQPLYWMRNSFSSKIDKTISSKQTSSFYARKEIKRLLIFKNSQLSWCF